MPADDVADSTDWLSTPLSGLSAVESALRCEVCKDFYKTPMITSCAHTFCSICIRRALSNDSKCPLCRATDQELKLRSNWSMEQTVAAFSEARTEALKFARSASIDKKQSPKRKADDNGESSQPEPHSKRLRSSARLSSRAEATPPAPSIEVVEDSEDEDFELETNDGLVPCPMCQRRMKEWQVFAHIESCPGPEAAEKLFSPADVDKIMNGRAAFKDSVKKVTDEALAKGAFGAPWIWVTNAKGQEEPFFGSDRFNHIYAFLDIPFQDVTVLTPNKL
ncbi:hypothetical protein NLG97_g9858 [Lecanicillium saksenae]|uniref:Uncharacterized protein n=1 Tax=Lecanicillium saksenae TaxID=468837 RepID=A0ACC1QES9_9HYPO|nr:hypothetical protein NLG97_g9858 [Lecanicillium saksenae]